MKAIHSKVLDDLDGACSGCFEALHKLNSNKVNR